MNTAELETLVIELEADLSAAKRLLERSRSGHLPIREVVATDGALRVQNQRSVTQTVGKVVGGLPKTFTTQDVFNGVRADISTATLGAVAQALYRLGNAGAIKRIKDAGGKMPALYEKIAK